MYNLAADFRNFLGSGKDLNFSFDKSKISETYGFGYFNPFFTSDGIGMGYNLYKRKYNVSKASSIFDYGLNSIGGDVNWSIPLSRYDYFLFGFGIDKSDLNINMASINTPNEAKAFVDREGIKFHEYSASVGWQHNSLDQYIFPTKGFKQKIIFKSTLPCSTLKYYSVDYVNSWFYPLTDKYVLNLSSELAYMASYKHDQYFPFFKHFYAGGAESVRGFQERSLGPKDSRSNPFGGNVLVLAKAQFISPPPFYPEVKSVRTALFLDAGQVYDTNYKYNYDSKGNELSSKSINPTGLRYSVGLSFTWDSPFRIPVIISVAQPINAKNTDNKRYFAFSFGTMF
jgi:outer membrane protein insertion porin family